MKVNGNTIKPGNVIEHKNSLWVATKTSHVKPGKGGAFAQIELRNLKDGTKLNERFRSSESIEKVILEETPHIFLYKEDQNLITHAEDNGYFLLEAKCNWKFAIENYCESYHLPWVHPGLNSYSKLEDHYHIQGLPNRFAGQGTLVYNPRFEGEKIFPNFPNWPSDKEEIAEYVALFPNVMLGIHKDHYYVYWLEPVSYNYTKEHMDIYYVGERAAKSDEYMSLRKQNYEQWHSIQSEDLRIIEGMQDGRQSPAFNGGNFSPVMDNPTHHFNKWVAQELLSTS